MTMAWISPSPAASEQQDLPSPGVGEDFRLRRRLDKSWEKYGVGFSAIRSLPYKGGPLTMPEGLETLGGAPQGVGAPRVLFWPSWLLLRDSKAVSPSSRENIFVVFFFELIEFQKVPQIAKYEKGGFLPPRN